MTGDGGAGESVLGRAVRILRAFSADEDRLTAAEIALRVGLPRSTAHRMVTELATLGMLDRAADGAYTVGTGLWEVGELAPVSMRLRERALPHMLRLYEASGENVHVAVLSADPPASAEALYVARVTGPHAIPTLSRMGGRHPLHATGVGKALLAQQDDAWLGAYFTAPRERETAYTVTEEDRLRAEILQARDVGYATTRQEMTLGNVSIAAPIPPTAGMPPAAVGVVTHLARADVARVGPLVVAAAREIARALDGDIR